MSVAAACRRKQAPMTDKFAALAAGIPPAVGRAAGVRGAAQVEIGSVVGMEPEGAGWKQKH